MTRVHHLRVTVLWLKTLQYVCENKKAVLSQGNRAMLREIK